MYHYQKGNFAMTMIFQLSAKPKYFMKSLPTTANVAAPLQSLKMLGLMMEVDRISHL